MNILVTFDENYVNQAAIMLFSLAISDPKEHFDIYILHTSLTEEDIEAIRQYLDPAQCTLLPIAVDRKLLDGMPVTTRYPQERYYRVLAAHYLPENLTRVLYLDPDLIVRKSLRGLYELDMQ
jgi:lipopolysaccharide biosynthesis glycosyltransferase